MDLQGPTEQSQSKLRAKRRMIRAILAIGGAVLFIAALDGGIWLHNWDPFGKSMDDVIASDKRNKDVQAEAYYNGWFNRDTIVFNLKDVSGQSSPLDIFRVLLQFAQSQKDHEYKQVILAAYGEKKFVVTGDYFHQLGVEYSTQNPMYTMRTFPHHVATMKGEHPFPEFEGGMFGVLGKEMEEFKQMNAQWYMNDYREKSK